jgi:phosphatidylinositol-3-phosphatase
MSRGTVLAAFCTATLAAGAGAPAAGLAEEVAADPKLRAPHACGRTPHKRPKIRHVIVIVFENHTFPQIIGRAPFLTSLAHRCGLAVNYHHNARVSLPNYLAMTSGSTHGLRRNCTPRQCPIRGPSIFTQLARHDKKWRVYQESMPTRCDRSSSGLYAARHNPAVYYRRLTGRQCRRHVVPLGSRSSGPFRRALEHRGRPAYMFVTPNLCHDMHDCSVATGDRWASAWMRTIVRSRAYRAGHTAVLLTFDEGSDRISHIPTIVVSPYTHAGKVSRTRYTHYSLLRTTERMLGIRRCLGKACSARGLSKAFRL